MNEIEMLKASVAALERERDELRERYKELETTASIRSQIAYETAKELLDSEKKEGRFREADVDSVPRTTEVE